MEKNEKIMQLATSFVVYVKSKNMRTAALALGISQPALFQRLSTFEECFSAPLMQKNGNQNNLTAYGEMVYLEMEFLLAKVENSLTSLKEAAKPSHEVVIRVGGRRELIESFEAICKWQNPVEYSFMSSAEAVSAVKNKSLDFCLHISSEADLKSRVLWTVGRELCFSKNASSKKVNFSNGALVKNNIAECLKTPFLKYKEFDLKTDSIFKRLGVSPQNIKVQRICEDWNLIAKMVENGKGFSFLPTNIFTAENVVRIPLDTGEEKENIVISYSAKSNRIQGKRKLIEAL